MQRSQIPHINLRCQLIFVVVGSAQDLAPLELLGRCMKPNRLNLSCYQLALDILLGNDKRPWNSNIVAISKLMNDPCACAPILFDYRYCNLFPPYSCHFVVSPIFMQTLTLTEVRSLCADFLHGIAMFTLAHVPRSRLPSFSCEHSAASISSRGK